MVRRALVLLGACLLVSPTTAQEPLTPERAEEAMRKAVTFFQNEVSAHGGYLWRYSADLKRGEGEGAASRTTVWVQPPGTPSVGMAYLDAYRRTRFDWLQESALAAAHALAQGQLASGGWDYRIEFDPKDRRRYAYLLDADSPRDAKSLRNTSTLDDNTTQAAVRFLMQVDQALEFRDPVIHRAAQYALEKLLAAQYPNGAWPQRFDGAPDPEKHPIRRAEYPASWPREWPDEDYRDYYTFNDNALADMIALMFDAAETYQDERFREAAQRGADFILLSQMPEPQPAWAQQYNAQMQPAWARKFEPPSVTGGESQRTLRTLMEVYRRTGDKKYLEPIPRALAYLKKSQLPDGRLARFYELHTNRPLYFTKDYVLTYQDDDLPTHYAFQVDSSLERLEKDYRELVDKGPPAPRKKGDDKSRMTDSLRKQAEAVVGRMDDRGAWVERGELRDSDREQDIIDTRTFIKNLDILSRYLQAAQP
jgi:PelA/Pel-15E family pectate lyase